MHSRLEQYLQTVEQNLHALPAEERHNELNEIRLHMEALVEANRELGSTEEEAVSQALAQFGRAQTVGKELIHAHQWGGQPQWRSLVGATTFNYFGGFVATQITSGLCLLTAHAPLMPVIWIGDSLLTTLSVGWLTGAVAPRHAVKGTLYSHLLRAVTTPFIFALFLPATIRSATLSSMSYWAMLVASTAISTPLAMFGAKLGAQWRSTRVKKMRIVG